MSTEGNNQNFSDFDLGLEAGDGVTAPTPVQPTSPVVEDGVQKVTDAASNAAAHAALKVAIDASSELSQREADKTYIIEKKKHMLNRAKNDEKREFVGHKIYADVFGKVYTFLYNTIPVTVRFDGSTQVFPKFVYDHLMKKIAEVSESNTNKDETVKLEG